MEAHVNSVKQTIFATAGVLDAAQKSVSLDQQQLEHFYYNLTPVQRENIFSSVEKSI